MNPTTSVPEVTVPAKAVDRDLKYDKSLERNPTSKVEIAEKLEKGWRYVTIPSKDIYDFKFGSVWNNVIELKPGVHLLPPDLADDVEERLKVRSEGDIRLMRPQAHRKSLEQTGNLPTTEG